MSQPQPFGIVPAGQPVMVTPTETPTPTSFLFAIPAGQKPFSHIVVFMLPGVVLPEGAAAAIYLVTPGQPGYSEPQTKFLGGIGPGKESAIFKIGSSATGQEQQQNIVVGVSVEPADSVAARMSQVGSGSLSSSAGEAAAAAAGDGAGGAGGGALVLAKTQSPSALVLAQRIIKNAFNFLASFSGTAGQTEVVPLKAFEDWWRKFESKVRSDPGFLERDD